MLRGISFWVDEKGKRQVYLLGNPIIWWGSLATVFIFMGIMCLDLLTAKRGIQLFFAGKFNN